MQRFGQPLQFSHDAPIVRYPLTDGQDDARPVGMADNYEYSMNTTYRDVWMHVVQIVFSKSTPQV